MAFTRAEVARRAGVDAAFVDRLCELGILRASEGDFTEGTSGGPASFIRWMRPARRIADRR